MKNEALSQRPLSPRPDLFHDPRAVVQGGARNRLAKAARNKMTTRIQMVIPTNQDFNQMFPVPYPTYAVKFHQTPFMRFWWRR